MKLIEPSFEIINPHSREEGVQLLRIIERLARISHKSEDLQTEDSWERFIQNVVMEHGDLSVIEHCSATAIIRTDRGISHELVRHRLFSFTQESTRFVSGKKKYPGGLEFIKPLSLPQGSAEWYLDDTLDLAEKNYLNMLVEGVRPQEARSVLPNCLATTIAVTGNYRNWRHFFLMRTSKESHPDMRRITVPMLKEFQRRIPLLFDDIEAEQRQVDNLRKPR